MNLPVQPGESMRDDGAFVRRVSVTESRAQSANFACHPGDLSLHLLLTSTNCADGTDNTVCAMVLTRNAVSPLSTTLGGGAVSTMAAAGLPLTAHGARPAPVRHRFHLGHLHRNAPIWVALAEPWR